MHSDQLPGALRHTGHLTTATDRTLQLALQPNGDGRKQELYDAMRAVCEEAHRQGLHAEDLIVLFKKAWHSRPELQTMSREETGRIFDAIVTMCVKEFYGDAS